MLECNPAGQEAALTLRTPEKGHLQVLCYTAKDVWPVQTQAGQRVSGMLFPYLCDGRHLGSLWGTLNLFSLAFLPRFYFPAGLCC